MLGIRRVAAAGSTVIDVYSTDAKLGRLGLRVLLDDRAFFPKYDAVLLARVGVDLGPLARLSGTIDAPTMIAMNAAVELDGASFADTAKRFLAGGFAAGRAPGGSAPLATAPALPSTSATGVASGGDASGVSPGSRAPGCSRASSPPTRAPRGEHLWLVFGSLALAIAAGVPLGIAAWRWPRAAGLLLARSPCCRPSRRWRCSRS